MKLFAALVLLFSFYCSLKSQIKLDIIFNETSKNDEGKLSYKNEFNDSLSLEKYLRDFISDLHSRAYLAASIDSILYAPYTVKAYLHKGLRYNQVITSFENIDDQVLKILNIRSDRYEKKALNISTFRILQNKIITHYENKGYPFATISLSGLEIKQDTISGKLTVNKNQYYNIDSIHIYGESPVNRRQLYRHISIHPGDTYSEKNFRKAGERIEKAPYLIKVRDPEMEFMSNSADLYLYLDRQQASSFSGIIGIMPGNNDNSIKLAGDLNLNLLNVFSRMESIRLDWQSPGNQVQQMELGIEQPYILGSSFGLDMNLHIYKQDSTYVKVDAEAGVLFTLPHRGVIRVFGKTTGTSIIATGQPESALYVPAAEIIGNIFGVSYRNNNIDNIINPYRGWMINTSLGAGNKNVKPPPGYVHNEERRTGFGEASTQFKWFIPLTKSSTILLSNLSGIKLNIGTEKSDNYFFANELFLLGGIHSIRGFDERSLAASAYSIQRLEFRHLFDAAGNVFIFFDGMAYNTKLPERDIFDIPFGFGAGLTFNTPAGQLSLSYALGSEMGNPVSFRSSRVHMGIVNRF